MVSVEWGVAECLSLNAGPGPRRYVGASLAALNGKKVLKNSFSFRCCCLGGKLSGIMLMKTSVKKATRDQLWSDSWNTQVIFYLLALIHPAPLADTWCPFYYTSHNLYQRTLVVVDSYFLQRQIEKSKNYCVKSVFWRKTQIMKINLSVSAGSWLFLCLSCGERKG